MSRLEFRVDGVLRRDYAPGERISYLPLESADMAGPEDFDTVPLLRVDLVRIEDASETVVFSSWCDRRSLPMVGPSWWPRFGVALPDLIVNDGR